MRTLVEKYNSLNSSFDECLVYSMGHEAGFFSEYNNMVLALLYCLERKIRFVLYSRNSNIMGIDGWRKHFLPFCEEAVDPRHQIFNYRYPQQFSAWFRLRRHWFKKGSGIAYLTADLWREFRSKDFERRHFLIPELELSGDIRSVCRSIIEFTYRFNPVTQAAVNKLISPVMAELPDVYAGLHVRSGDKASEQRLLSVDEYMAKLKATAPDLRDIFVFTDDYLRFENLSDSYSGYRFRTLCQPDERGYHHCAFLAEDQSARAQRLVNLFASIEILASAQIFIGTFSANPGMFLGMRMNRDRVIGADYDCWGIW